MKEIMEGFRTLLIWASNLPPLPKGLMTFGVVAFSAFTIAVLWMKPTAMVKAGNNGVTKPDASVVASGDVKKLDGSDNTDAKKWPKDKTIDELKRTLDGISRENAKLLIVVASADQFGIYVDDLAHKLGITRAEALLRSQNLQKDGLVEVRELTDFNIELNKDLMNVLAPNPKQFLKSYLHP
jgi:hypothetical protein